MPTKKWIIYTKQALVFKDDLKILHKFWNHKRNSLKFIEKENKCF